VTCSPTLATPTATPRPGQSRSHPEFFDAEDRLQVRYEMLRGPAQGEMSVVEACRLFAVSRQTFYTLRRVVAERFGISLHRRTIERLLVPKSGR
jgi:hypothetical protein